jgi:hypothetical protein
MNGLGLSVNGLTNTQVKISSGVTIDSTATFQMVNNSDVTISAANTGINGIDTGVLVASKVYAVFLVSDPVTNLPTGGMVSLSYTQPILPFGYSAFALVGYITTDSNAHFLAGYWTAGNSTTRTFTYDASQITAITAGAATSYSPVNLSAFVPLKNNMPVYVSSLLSPGAAGQSVSFQGGTSTGTQVVISGQVAAVIVSSISTILAQTVTISLIPSPVINYKVSNAASSVAVGVTGYSFDLA